MLEGPATYPLLRGRRHRRGLLRRIRRSVGAIPFRTIRLVAILLAGAMLVAGLVWLARRPAPPDPDLELRLSLGSLQRGNYSAARNHAQSALKVRPDWGLAHAVLARSHLALGNGVAAEGEMQRAAASGFDMARGHQLLAHAYLLEGDLARAIEEAAEAPPRFAIYAGRVRALALADEGDFGAAIVLLERIVSDHPTRGDAWSDLGRVRYRAGNLAGAGEAAARAASLNPANLEALTLRGELLRSQYGLVAALPWFDAALARDAYFHPALIEQAATLGDLGRNVEALGATRRALLARPGSAQAFYLHAVIAARAGNFDLSAAMLVRTGGALGSLPGALMLAGAIDYAHGRDQQAIGRWRDLLARQPMNLAARRLLGAAQLRAGDARGALATLRPIVLRSDADSYTLRTVGRAFERVGERDRAARFLDRAAAPTSGAAMPFGEDDALPVLALAAADAPGNATAAVEYIRGLIEAGDVRAALARARGLASHSPGAPAAELLVGDTLMLLGRYSDAADAYIRAADLDFSEPTLLRLVEALERAGRRADAANALALYLGQSPQSITARRVAANLRLATRDWLAAIDTLEGLRSAIGNRDAILMAQLATAYAGAGDAASATRFGRAADALAPMNPLVADAFGWSLYLAGRQAAALQLVGKAVGLAPADPMIRWHLAQLFAEAGRNEDARAAITSALANPRFTERAGAAALLRRIGG